jgi:hypothetical protein
MYFSAASPPLLFPRPTLGLGLGKEPQRKSNTVKVKEKVMAVLYWPLTLLCNLWNDAGGPNYERVKERNAISGGPASDHWHHASGVKDQASEDSNIFD